MPGLSPSRRRELKARAHPLDPVVLIGAAGLTSAVLAEIDRGLKSHELVKVRVPGADRTGARMIFRRSAAEPERSRSARRKVLVLFRENPNRLGFPGGIASQETQRR